MVTAHGAGRRIAGAARAPPDAGRDAVAADAGRPPGEARKKSRITDWLRGSYGSAYRGMFAFNDTFDRILLRSPGLRHRDRALAGISNFFTNLQQPLRHRLLLQGIGASRHARRAVRLNAFWALAASGSGNRRRHPAARLTASDRRWRSGVAGFALSRAAAVWSARCATASAGGVNASVSPVGWRARGAAVSRAFTVSTRASVLPYEAMMEGAADRYLLATPAAPPLPDHRLQRRDARLPAAGLRVRDSVSICETRTSAPGSYP